MPPTLQAIETDQFGKATFALDLNGNEDFDVNRFDEQVRAVAATGEGRKRESLKFVVVGSKMILFSFDRTHVETYMDLPRDTYDGELACAGMVSVGEGERSIWGDSGTLETYRGFPKEASNNFKHKVLKEALGEYFEVR